MDANLKGPFLMSRAALPAAAARRADRQPELDRRLHRARRPLPAAKAGVVGLTCALALELGPLGITANAVAPGFIEDTEFFGGGLGEQVHHVNGGWVLGR